MKVTLTDQELVDKVNVWVKKLAESGGRKWTLEVPVNFDKDPDVLIVELGQRLLAKSQPSALTEATSGVELKKQIEEILHKNIKYVPQVDGVVSFGAIEELYELLRTHSSTPPTATPEAAKEQREVKAIIDDILSELNNVQLIKHSAMAAAIRAAITLAHRANQLLDRTTTLPASTALNDERAKGFGEFLLKHSYWAYDGYWFSYNTTMRTTEQVYGRYLATLPTPTKK